jgi:hypothetical protein
VIGLCAGLGELPVHRDDAQRELPGRQSVNTMNGVATMAVTIA